MTSQLNYLIAQQRQAELVSRAEQARLAKSRLARRSAPRWDPTQAGGRSPSLAPATPPRVHMNASYPTPEGVDPKELDEQVEGMYDRGLATEEPRPAPPHAGALAEAPGYPPLCAHGMNSLTDSGYDLALGRLRRG